MHLGQLDMVYNLNCVVETLLKKFYNFFRFEYTWEGFIAGCWEYLRRFTISFVLSLIEKVYNLLGVESPRLGQEKGHAEEAAQGQHGEAPPQTWGQN